MTCVYCNISLFLFLFTSMLSVHTRADRVGRRVTMERPYLSWVWTNLLGKRKWSPVLSLSPTNGQRVLISPLLAQAGLVLRDKTPLCSPQRALACCHHSARNIFPIKHLALSHHSPWLLSRKFRAISLLSRCCGCPGISTPFSRRPRQPQPLI